ncbi:hypothetical protein SPRG_04555 [Saprolegnia parasitica CBS 223.65]|uniref:Uncharacterized protein n=1 Tax=Saprolegnia parasitica (strain CBS 223.65) TaxID=695850 RepID=A0A067CIV3_SAPPC|nr:hypothetical protein SPRG_04555 [Saprolegnia parasitica CBS 223.65]KDO30654.1 hypothetical protein SPRG_04555 [Saprolegnia parasitica CBS 223.65]|eukprot:XP_012198864.1 hypothetical protein SPRG_04555 [Saprolegnia parasitica CBS 223.65]
MSSNNSPTKTVQGPDPVPSTHAPTAPADDDRAAGEPVLTADHYSLEAVCKDGDATALAAVRRWLESGYAEVLDLTYFGSTGSDELATVLRKTTTLTSLTFRFHKSGFLDPLMAVAPSFRRLTSLHLAGCADALPAYAQLLARLNATQLQSLHVYCGHGDPSDISGPLVVLPALEALTVSFGRFRTSSMLPSALLPPTLRRVTLNKTAFSPTAWDAFAAHVAGPCLLDEIIFHDCTVFLVGVEYQVEKWLARWIERGVRKLAIYDTTEHAASALLRALPGCSSSVGVVLDIDSDLSMQTYLLFGRALASSRGVTIKLPPFMNCAGDERVVAEIQDMAAKYQIACHHQIVRGRVHRLVLEGPACAA